MPATGLLVVSPAPLSFWGGYDPNTGEVIDRRHPLSGRRLAGCILALPWTRGSSPTTAILLESVRLHTAPAAILLPKVDTFIALAAVVEPLAEANREAAKNRTGAYARSGPSTWKPCSRRPAVSWHNRLVAESNRSYILDVVDKAQDETDGEYKDSLCRTLTEAIAELCASAKDDALP